MQQPYVNNIYFIYICNFIKTNIYMYTKNLYVYAYLLFLQIFI